MSINKKKVFFWYLMIVCFKCERSTLISWNKYGFKISWVYKVLPNHSIKNVSCNQQIISNNSFSTNGSYLFSSIESFELAFDENCNSRQSENFYYYNSLSHVIVLWNIPDFAHVWTVKLRFLHNYKFLSALLFLALYAKKEKNSFIVITDNNWWYAIFT